MADTLTLTLEPRTVLGKKVKSLRKAGIVPAHLYGAGAGSQALQCDAKTLIKVLSEAGMNTPISVTISGQREKRLTFVREIQWDPVRGDMLHVDFLHVDVANEITASVPIVLTGESPAARMVADGAVVQLLRELEVQALPLDIPQEISIDLAAIQEPGDVIRVGAAPLPANVVALTDPEEMIARLEISQAEAAAPGDEEGLGGPDGDAAGEGS